jgi:hypothetical protein
LVGARCRRFHGFGILPDGSCVFPFCENLALGDDRHLVWESVHHFEHIDRRLTFWIL